MQRSPSAILTVGVIISMAAGCGDPTQPAVPAPPVNTAPEAFAGADVLVRLPARTGVLNGSATDTESNIAAYSWKKIHGPDSYSIESPRSIRTNLTNLQRGWYDFELAVTDDGGLTAKDTVGVLVYDPLLDGENEVVFRNLHWYCPMGCTLWIEDFRGYVGSSTAIKVYVKEDGVGSWIEAAPESQWAPESSYSWAIYEKQIVIYSTWPINESGAVEVLLRF